VPTVLRVSPVAPNGVDSETIAQAARVIRDGGLVAFPTETVYGLGANALDADAVGRIFVAKGRPAINPLIVHVTGAEQAATVGHWTPEAQRLAEQFWPGPLTLVLERRPQVADVVTAGLDTVAVRAPDHPVALALIAAAGVPVAAPSANRSGAVSPTCAEHVVASLGDRVDLVLDAGPTQVGIESTVLALGPLRLLRLGHVSRAAIQACVGPVVMATQASDEGPTSPGQLLRHYAPHARLIAVACGDGPAMVEALADRDRAGLITHRATSAHDPQVRLPSDPEGFARGLYAALHQLDGACDTIIIESVPAGEEWAAVRDRLERATRD
jgi:L-threonylcarbamoyladenylate synthase